MGSPLSFYKVALAAVVSVGALSSALFGCTTRGDGSFVSDNPAGPGNGFNDAEGTGSSGSSSSGDPSTGDDRGDAERAIAEADIIQIKDDRLYALSRFSGLAVIDVQTPDNLKLLGRYRADGIPFEMYLRDNRVYAMFSSWGHSVVEEGVWKWVTSSRVEALDVTNPASITSVGAFTMPGEIADSRIVGDVLYAVTYEDGYCWDCDVLPNTRVTSIAVGDPASFHAIEQITYTVPDPIYYGWWKKSVAVSQDRMYVAGVEWDGQADEGHSTIQVIDISDPGGHLAQGATVEVKGQIESRWQMDEKDGVLRVVSQPGIWWSGAVPAVQTFTVSSATDIAPLGYLDLTLPKPETLRSVRFDGDRVYAITAEQKDPLFTIDLSDPANPVQKGALEMPGFVYHMEPRGDRVIALGFDNGNVDGSLHVSLFDVSDMMNPTMLSRVNFGGDWASLAEDQDRIHKAFKIDDTMGAIFVPYAGWSYTNDQYACGAYKSGIQIVDFTQDTLTKRGVAEAWGEARRALVAHDRLLTVSDSEVRTYDVTNRDAPQKTSSITLAFTSTQAVQAGASLVRLSSDWWTGAARLDVVPASDPERADPVGSLDLATLNDDPNQWCWGWGYYGARVFANGNMVTLARTVYDYNSPNGVYTTNLDVALIDVSDPAHPALRGRIKVPSADSYSWYDGIVNSGDWMVQVGSTLVTRAIQRTSWDSGSEQDAKLILLDLSNPNAPVLASTVALPSALGHSPLLVNGSTIALSHWVAEGDNQLRFFYDRINIANPASPVVLPPLNVPGSVAAVLGGGGSVVTIDYARTTLADLSVTECYQRFGWGARFQPVTQDGSIGVCDGVSRVFKLVNVVADVPMVFDAYTVESGYFDTVMAGDNRVFAVGGGYYGYYYEDVAYSGGEGARDALVIGTLAGAQLQAATMAFEPSDSGYPVAVAGKKLLLGGYSPPSLAILDATDMGALHYERLADLNGYLYSVTVAGDQALCSMGEYGLQAVSLAE